MGSQACLDDGSTFGPCDGEIVPAAEICATREQDLDCDGATDDVAGTGEACTVGVGACTVDGVMACGADDAVACDAVAGEPAVEICDGIDNDCNGVIDDVATLGDACSAGVGACAANGVRVCDLDAQAVVCDAVAGEPAVEICDGVDNDCNDAIDDVATLGDACSVGVGACAANGVRVCDLDAQAVICDAVAGDPGVEICDGIDNDCEGDVDDVATLGDACSVGVGACAADGTNVCDLDAQAVVCGAVEGGGGVEICDGLDNDCDGQIDNVATLGDACGVGVGACAANGTRVCDLNAQAVVCDAVAGVPGVEICDGIDNDCNGAVDNVATVGDACDVGVGACATNGTRVCDLNAQAVICDAVAGVPGVEICDGIDNDCDGAVDDVPGLGQACSAGQGVCQRHGNRICDVGARQLICNAQPGPVGDETCDNRDEDCDGRTDESVTQACYGGRDGTQDVGACRGGLRTCNGGGFGACQGQVTPIAEFCSGQDNDCDGVVDDIKAQFDYTDYPADLQCFDFAVADLDGNGRTDVVCSLNGDDRRIAYWLDAGVGQLGAERYTAALPARAYTVKLGDLDRDGDLDVVAGLGNRLPQVLLNDNGNLGAPVQAFDYDPGDGPVGDGGLALADVTGDGILDIVTSIRAAGEANGRLIVAPGNGNGTFGEPVVHSVSPDFTEIVLGDVDQDGDVDVMGLGGRTMGVLRRNGANFDDYQELLAFPNYPREMVYTDLNGDGRRDLAFGTEARWFFGRAQGADFAFVETADRATIMAITAGNFDCDPLPELAMIRSNPAVPFIIIGEPVTQSHAYERGAAHGWTIEAVDFNQDGLDDLILPRADGGFSVARQRP